MVFELSENYIPQNFPHRTDQILKIKNILDNFKKFNYGQNLLIQGTTGSGKTSILKKVLGDHGNYYYVDTTSLYTTFKILKYLNNSGIQSDGIGILTGRFKDKLRQEPMPVVIDETNKIRDIEKLMDCINSIYRSVQVPFVIITTKWNFLSDIPTDARNTLFFNVLQFTKYNADELYDILIDRLNLIKDKVPMLDESTLKFICALGAKEGDARIALELTLNSILNNNFDEAYIFEYYNKKQNEDWEQWINGIGSSEKIFLESLLELSLIKQEISSLDIYNSMKHYGPSRISQLITIFENYGIIKTSYRNLGGRKGRYRIVSFANDEIKNKIDKLLIEPN